MLLIKPGWLPATIGISMATGAIVSYIVAVVRGDVTPFVPYISEAGAKPPQSGIFSLSLIISGFFSILTMYSRYMIVKDLNKNAFLEVTIFNILALISGFVSTFGLILVASYPVSVQEVAHNIGAYTLFLSGVIYSCLQTRISFKMSPFYNGSIICWIRFAITIVSVVAIAIIVTYDPIAKSIWSSSLQEHSKVYRKPGDVGFEEFLVASIAEWFLALSFILFFYTFIREFNKIYIQFKAVPLVTHFDDEPFRDKRTLSWEEEQPILGS